MKARFLLALLPVWCSPQALAADDLAPYPPADDGYERMVFMLPPEADETAHKVEIIVGKTQLVDCNATWFHGDMTTETVKGWGYSYYLVKKISGRSTTMRLCPADEPKKRAFVRMRGSDQLLRYNSKLPMVVYVPEGFEVKYRIWSASADLQSVQVR